jgi:membrane protease YdiL (CAAX protease family)
MPQQEIEATGAHGYFNRMEPPAGMYVLEGMESYTSSIRSQIYVGAYLALWTTALVLLRTFEGFETSEALATMVILGVILPALAMLATRRVSALPYVVRQPRIEAAALLIYLAAIAWTLVTGFGWVARLGAEPLHSIVLLGIKLMEFVVVPAAVILAVGRYKFAELAPISLRWHDLLPALWMSLAVLLMQSVLGRGLEDIRGAHLPAWVLAAATPLSFIWLMIETGVVEEFFFRVLLQERLAAMLRSPWGGLVVAALLFGLAHAPGFYLRTAATQEALGAHPSLLMAVGYSIVLTSLAGMFLGVLWMRTKNLAVLVICHAAGDLLPNLVPWARAFHLAR